MKGSLPLRVGVTLIIGVWAAACAKPPPPPAPEVEDPKPEDAPPPKCEELKEDCKAKADTRLAIPGTELAFTPPEGWSYASNDKVAATQKSGKGAALVFTSAELEKGWAKKKKQREDLGADLVKFLAIDEAPKTTSFHGEEKVGDMKMSLGEVVDMARKGEKGFLLLVSAEVDGRMIVGVAFAPAEDKDAPGMIRASIRGLTKAAASKTADDGKPAKDKPEAPDAGKGESDKKGDEKEKK